VEFSIRTVCNSYGTPEMRPFLGKRREILVNGTIKMISAASLKKSIGIQADDESETRRSVVFGKELWMQATGVPQKTTEIAASRAPSPFRVTSTVSKGREKRGAVRCRKREGKRLASRRSGLWNWNSKICLK